MPEEERDDAKAGGEKTAAGVAGAFERGQHCMGSGLAGEVLDLADDLRLIASRARLK